MTPFKTESWLWFGIVMAIVVLRFVSRILHFKSFVRFQVDDYIMMYLACVYTTFLVLINIAFHTNTNLIDPHDIPTLTPADIAERTFGSKLIVAVEMTMCMIQWGTKISLLCLYGRLTENLVQNTFVKVVGVYVVTTYCVMLVLYLGYWCRPFSDYWQTPTDNIQCTTALHHLIVNLAFNLSSDILVMAIPLPLLLRARLEIKRKILLCFPFTLGFFSIICAILSKYVSFTHPFSPVWSYWYTREASCVMIVANMPYTWGLIRRVFKAKSFWGRVSVESQNEVERLDETQDTGMEMIGGEMREMRGLAIETGSMPSEKGVFGPSWRGLSKAFVNNKSSSKSASEIVIEVKDHSERSSPTGTQSSDSVIEEPWKNISWTRAATAVDITPVTTMQSNVSTDCLKPPSPVIHAGTRRTEQRRTSTITEYRRLSTLSAKRARRSVSEASRRSTRTSVNVDAVDRLYRLSDEDLITDLEAARPRSHSSHHSGFG